MKTIGIINPSSPSNTPIDQKLITNWFKEKKLNAVWGENALQTCRFLAGTDEQRLADIHQFFADTHIDMIVALKGGYGSGRLLDKLDYAMITKNKKPFIGFSDTTALQLALWEKSKLPSVSGLSPRRDVTSSGVDGLINQTFDAYLSQKPMSIALTPITPTNKIITGTLIGGTLSLIDELIGTPYCPHFKDSILFIEDVQEEPYKIDRMLTHLRLAGVFDEVNAIIWGDFYQCLSSDKNDGTLQDVLNDIHQKIPHVVMYQGLPYGHSNSRILLPIGTSATLDKETLSFQYHL